MHKQVGRQLWQVVRLGRMPSVSRTTNIEAAVGVSGGVQQAHAKARVPPAHVGVRVSLLWPVAPCVAHMPCAAVLCTVHAHGSTNSLIAIQLLCASSSPAVLDVSTNSSHHFLHCCAGDSLVQTVCQACVVC